MPEPVGIETVHALNGMNDSIPPDAVDASSRVTVYYNLGRVEMRKSNFRKALEWLQKAEQIRQNEGLPVRASLLERMGFCYKALNEAELAVDHYRRAIDIYAAGDPEKRLPGALMNLGILYDDWGWFEQSLECYRKSLRMHLAAGDSISAAYILSNVAGIYSKTVGHVKAREYTYQALEIFRKKDDHAGMGYALNGLGSSYCLTGDPARGMDYYRQSIHAYEKAGRYEGMSFTYGNLGEALMAERNYPEARQCFEKAFTLAEQAKSDLARCTALASLGRYHFKTGQPGKANELVLKSQEIAVKRGLKQQMADNYQLLAEIGAARGNFSKAYQYLQQYNVVIDSLRSEKNRKTVAEMEAKYSLERKEGRIARLVKENELNQQIIASKNRFTGVVFAASVVVLILLSLVTRFYYLKGKAYQKYIRVTVEQLKRESFLHKSSVPDRRTDLRSEATLVPDDSNGSSGSKGDLLLIRKLKELVEDGRLFLDPNLSLVDTAARLNTNTTYLSRAVNEVIGKSFPAYINELRIHEAQRMLADTAYANRSIEGIGMMAGFNSKSAFNDAFRKFTGMTPSYFQRSALKMESS